MSTIRLWEHFTKLFQFKGREDRASFWPYAAVVYGIMTLGSLVAILPVMSSVSHAAEEAAAQGSNSFPPPFGMFFGGMIIVMAFAIALYAAAVARRLHDAGLSALWGLMPLPFLAFSMVKMRSLFESFGSTHHAMDDFIAVAVSNSVYTLTLIALIVLLARRSDPGRNRFDLD